MEVYCARNDDASQFRALKTELDPTSMGPEPRIRIERMSILDVRPVLHIEALSFPTQWPANAFLGEINDNKLARYFVARADTPNVAEEIVGYGGIWVVLEDAHVTTVAVHPDWRGRGIGEALIIRMLRETITGGASWMTLEVRRSNIAAQRLYGKYGFTIVSTRRGYYSDDGEDAFVMWAGNLRGDLFRSRLKTLERELASKNGIRPQ
jgi:ribosomal-protein-alanine N-acetyltransferase